VSYHDELDDLHADILLELYRRHLKSEERALALASPKKLLLFLQTTPVRNDAQNLPLSSFLRRIRLDSGISLEDFASTLALPVELLEQLETNFSVPWTVAPPSMADVACLFRFHITTLQNLTQNSLDVAYFSGHMTDRESSRQAMSSWLGEVRAELERREVIELLD
jgi:transcriptional regulator with XRE-family HTH domain